MKRRAWILLPLVFVAGLFAAYHATAATKDTNASSSITPIGNGQFRWNVTQLSPDSPIDHFTFVSGPGFAVSSVVSITPQGGSCSVSGRNVPCDISLMLAPCMCQPGGSVDIVLQASGDPAGSTLQVNGATFPVTVNPGTGTTTTTATTTTVLTTTVATTTTTTTTPPPPAVRCRVPALVGKTLAAAKAALRNAHCGVGAVTTVRSKAKKGTVVSSSPRAGAAAAAGAKVALRVSRGPK